MKRVMEDGPWSFEQNLLILKRLEPNVSPLEADLTSTEFWIQAHNVPANFITEKVATVIGSSLGELMAVDHKNFDGTWKQFLRVRVLIDITKPLKRKMKMKKNGGECFWIEFKYERLPNFCFLCGIIGHTERFCFKHFEGVNEETERPYGPWLRATGRRSTANMGSPWLVTEISRAETKVHTRTQAVETTEAAGRQSISKVGASERTAGITMKTGGSTSEGSGEERDKNNPSQINDVCWDVSMKEDGMFVLNEMDQKRKRESEIDPADVLATTMEVDCVANGLSKNGLEVGPGCQAHLRK